MNEQTQDIYIKLCLNDLNKGPAVFFPWNLKVPKRKLPTEGLRIKVIHCPKEERKVLFYW